MDTVALAVEFITKGYVVVPQAVVGAELEAMRTAFERMASRLGKRHFMADEIVASPELVNFIGHPGAMPVIEAFFNYYEHEPAVACIHLCRDAFNPADLPLPFTGPTEATKDALHSDVGDTTNSRLSFRTLNLSVASFLWLDDTFPDAGCLLQVPGSHHLSRESHEGCVISPPMELVKQHFPLDFVAARAGDVVLQRGFNIHGTGPAPRQKRRQLRVDYTPRAMYRQLSLDGRQDLHQQFSPETRSMLPPERQRYFV